MSFKFISSPYLSYTQNLLIEAYPTFPLACRALIDVAYPDKDSALVGKLEFFGCPKIFRSNELVFLVAIPVPEFSHTKVNFGASEAPCEKVQKLKFLASLGPGYVVDFVGCKMFFVARVPFVKGVRPAKGWDSDDSEVAKTPIGSSTDSRNGLESYFSRDSKQADDIASPNGVVPNFPE